MSASVGFIGLGHMGGNMAARFLDAGHTVFGTSRSRQTAHQLIEQGLEWRETPRDVAAAADVVFTSLPNDSVLESVTSGPDGVFAGLAAGKTWVDVSTISPDVSRELAGKARATGAFAVEAPVSGSVPQVKAGNLTIMVAGEEDAFARVEPILRELGRPTYIGAAGQGQLMKLAVNISLAVQMLAFSEGLLLAERGGIDVKLAADVMTSSAIGSPMLKAREPLVLDLPEDAYFDVGLMDKDIGLARATGRRLNSPLPTADRTAEILKVARDMGYEHRDIAALFEVLRRMSTDHQDQRAA
jgi:3-hydroxyisobutyrate dehydrogenase-like beta-hydroxyacid dehydrogenase